jgi:hypothetical protein
MNRIFETKLEGSAAVKASLDAQPKKRRWRYAK